MSEKRSSVWVKVPVVWRMSSIRGSVPKNPKLLAEFADRRDEKAAKTESVLSYRQPGPRGLCEAGQAATALSEITGEDRKVRTVTECAEQESETWPSPDEDVSALNRMWLSFRGDDKGFFVRAGGIRHHYKDCASSLVQLMAKDGIKNFHAKVSKELYLIGEGAGGDRVYLRRGDDYIEKADGYEDRTMNAITPQGPRSFLQRVDEINDVELRFTLHCLRGGVIDAGVLDMLHEYGGVHGSFQDRSLGHGRYVAWVAWPD